jgi:hypothetical protein
MEGGMADGSEQHAREGDRFAWIDPGVSVWDQWGAVPPPPKVGPTRSLESFADRAPQAAPAPQPPPIAPEPEPSRAAGPEAGDEEAKPAPTFHDFNAELDVAELDERLRPVTTWAARAISVNRSTLGFRSRRMCYAKKLLLVAVHLLDDKPLVLAGRVTSCDYDGEGLYIVDLELMPKPTSEEIRLWEAQR